MTIITSSFTEGVTQADGRCYVTEIHTSDDGQSFKFEYLLLQGVDPYDIMQSRCEKLSSQIESKRRINEFIVGTSLPLSVYEFLSRFTTAERSAIRALALTDVIAEDFMHMLNIAGAVYLSDPLTQQGLQYLVFKGCITHNRGEEIGGIDG